MLPSIYIVAWKFMQFHLHYQHRFVSNLYKVSKKLKISQICLKNAYIVFLEILLCAVHQIVHVFEHKADENERPGEKNAAEGG